MSKARHLAVLASAFLQVYVSEASACSNPPCHTSTRTGDPRKVSYESEISSPAHARATSADKKKSETRNSRNEKGSQSQADLRFQKK